MSSPDTMPRAPYLRLLPRFAMTPIGLLMLMVVANQLSFQTWMTLLNNFTHAEAGFKGSDIGLLQSVREIPGFLAFGAILLIVFMREQTLAIVSLVMLAAGTALTGLFPTTSGLLLTTLLFSTGFHYFETMRQSLSLQWLPKGQAALGLGRIISAESFAALAAFGFVYLTFTVLGLGYARVYALAGAMTLALVAVVVLGYPYFRQDVKQRTHLVLRGRYWLFYALTFLDGARRQIFVVFAGWMMVEKFGYSVGALTTLFVINHLFNMALAPRIGRLVMRFGERAALQIEYVGLALVFAGYAFVEDHRIAAGLYLVDHAFFAMSMATASYFQRIADPADIAPTAAVSFSINHIAAVFLPVTLGLVWLRDPGLVFLLGTGLAIGSIVLSSLIPRTPAEGHEVIWRRQAVPAE
ncbi:MAG: MFS transporter [Hyphomicrobiaceae bacterium]